MSALDKICIKDDLEVYVNNIKFQVSDQSGNCTAQFQESSAIQLMGYAIKLMLMLCCSFGFITIVCYWLLWQN